MAKLTFNPVYNKNRRGYKRLVKDFKIKSGETIDFPPRLALAYYGDRNYTITWEEKYRDELSKLEERKFKYIKDKTGAAGVKDVIDNVLLPKAKKKAFSKKIIKEAAKPEVKKPAPKKKIEKKEPKKEELKPPIEKKKPAKKAAPKAKKPTKDSEL